MGPEVVFCSYCGCNIWVVITPRTQPENLICSECLKIKKDKMKTFNEYFKEEKMTNDKLTSLFREQMKQGKVYRFEKYGDVTARKAKVGEIITTVIDNKVETKSKPAETGDMVVTGVNDEEYLIKSNKFNSLYKKNGEKYSPIGKVKAFKVTDKMGKFNFIAPWGEEMLAEPGDYIATSITDNYDDTKLYRIEKKVFNSTFRLLSR